jgi:hypothetical protein
MRYAPPKPGKHRHTYRLCDVSTLTLANRFGVYEALLLYVCTQCGKVMPYSVAISHDRPVPTYQEVTTVERWQAEHPAATRERMRG